MSRVAAVAAVLAGLANGCDGRGSDRPGVEDPNALLGGDGEDNGASLSEEDFRRQRERLVEFLARPVQGRRPIKDQRLLKALRRVPRHEFVPPGSRGRSYHDSALMIAENQTISQPYLVALMTELLELKGNERVLEVGTGSGYQAAVLGELVAEVYTIEIRPALKEAAERKLRELKERGALGYRKLVSLLGDGSKGYSTAKPYDCIVVTAAPSTVPEELVDQLKPGGRLVVPVGKVVQELQLVRKSQDGTSFSLEFVDFVRFVELVEED